MIKPMKKKNIVGSRIRKARQDAKPAITQSDLVARLQLEGLKDIDQPIISRIEKGDRIVADYEIKAIAKALKVSVGWLLKEK